MSGNDLAGVADNELTGLAASVGREFGMTAEQVVAHIAMGDRRHPDAPEHECGAIDPRDDADRFWCRRDPGHGGGLHNRYPDEQTGLTA